ncbi:MAG: hypothetical protein J6S21_02125 [Victivallales bacterium]|nr:hypothetical protein [Victivallales bacterium]
MLLPLCASAAGFLWQVSVDEAVSGENIALEFGSGEACQRPAPPFTAMLGGKECYLLNPANLGESAQVSGAFSRLCTDIRASVGRDTRWVIAAGSDMTLYFQGTPGEKLYFHRERRTFGGEVVSSSGEVGASMYLRSGTLMALAQTPITSLPDVAFPDDSYGITAVSGEDGLLRGEVPSASSPALFAGTPTEIHFAAGTARVAVSVAGETFLEEGVNLPECRWLCTLELPEGCGLSGKPSYRDGIFSFTADASGSYRVTMQALAAAPSPLMTSFLRDGVPSSGISWIIPSVATLDFDDNGRIERTDAVYLYNFISGGIPGTRDKWFAEAHLGQHLAVEPQQLRNALKSLREMGMALDYDGNGTVDNNDAAYAWNFIAAGCPADDGSGFSAESLKPNTSGADAEALRAALLKLREMTNE